MADYITRSLRLILILGSLSLGLLFGESNSSVSLILTVEGVGLALTARFLTAILSQQGVRSGRGVPVAVTTFAILLPVVLSLLLLPLPAARAANLTVNTTVDRIDAGDCAAIKVGDLSKNGDKLTSLREAICVANNTSGPDQITLPARTYHLTIRNPSVNTDENVNEIGDLDITADLAIVGAGAKTTIIDAGGQTGLDDRVFHILNGTVNISGVTIQRGSARTEPGELNFDVKNGGGIYVEKNGSLALTNSTVVANTALDSGGGIYNVGMIALNGVTIYDNFSEENGGGILNTIAPDEKKGILTGVNVTISGNKSGNEEESKNGRGGGIRNLLGIITLTNTTIVENEVINNISSNNAGAGIDSAGSARVTLINTIVANNEVMTDNQTFNVNCRGNFADGGNNLENSDSCGFDPAGSNVAIELGPLTTANGGGTPTHALPAGSPAVDAGNNVACPSTDQRGKARVDQPGVGQDGSPACDIGAFEFDKLVVLTLNPTSRSFKEGDNGTVKTNFDVILSEAINTEVTVEYETDDDTATIADNDYAAANGVITFPPGSVAPQNISLTINSDTKPESDETFLVRLHNPRWAAVGGVPGRVTIQNDDIFPEVSINNISVTEGDTGTTEAIFTVMLSRPSSAPVMVNYSTANGTARVNENDYIADAGVLTFDPNIVEQSIRILIQGDTEVESDETFFVNLSMVRGGRLVDSQGLGLILDNERVDILISDAIVEEKDIGETSEAVFKVTLSRAKGAPITVNYRTSEITAGDIAHKATAETDYKHSKGTIKFSPAVTLHNIIVPVFGDKENEEDEVFLVTLSEATEAVIADSEGQGTIIDNDNSFGVYLPVLINRTLVKR